MYENTHSAAALQNPLVVPDTRESTRDKANNAWNERSWSPPLDPGFLGVRSAR